MPEAQLPTEVAHPSPSNRAGPSHISFSTSRVVPKCRNLAGDNCRSFSRYGRSASQTAVRHASSCVLNSPSGFSAKYASSVESDASGYWKSP